VLGWPQPRGYPARECLLVIRARRPMSSALPAGQHFET
jgi:hypothetical protein